MTVGELIGQLENFYGDAEVVCFNLDNSNTYDFIDVDWDEDPDQNKPKVLVFVQQ